ncbi:MAG TPA: hypothetical protein VIE65_20645 [Methylobacter sp.]
MAVKPLEGILMRICNILTINTKWSFLIIKKLLSGLCAAALVFTFALPAHAESLMSLPKLPGHKEFPDIGIDKWNYKGQCGSAKILALQAGNILNKNFPGLTALTLRMKLKISNPSSHPGLVLDAPTGQVTGVVCAQTAQGKKILIWKADQTEITRTSEDIQFFVIDPETMDYIAPTDRENGRCDKACAKSLVGDDKTIALLFANYVKTEEPKGSANFSTKDGKNYIGTCGPARITVKNIDEISDNNFVPYFSGPDDLDSFNIEIYEPGEPDKVLKYAEDSYNRIDCVQTKHGKRILIGTQCNGSASICGNTFNYYDVIDPKKIKQVNSSKEECDVNCAIRLLGKQIVTDFNR